jgi:hypothetical protein
MKVGESGDKLFAFARHVATEQLGCVYPNTPDPQYIERLAVPGGVTMNFEEIFRKALRNTIELWGWLALALQKKPSPLDSLISWNLDTGIDEENHMVYWS